jgi:hypothetical protein
VLTQSREKDHLELLGNKKFKNSIFMHALVAKSYVSFQALSSMTLG